MIKPESEDQQRPISSFFQRFWGSSSGKNKRIYFLTEMSLFFRR